jgi:Domain of unknown function (DUF1825)/STI1 domain
VPSRLRVATRAAGNDDMPRSSEFFASEIVQREATDIYRDFSSLSQMQTKYFAFDSEGKRLYLDQMETFVERLKIFTMRYSLSDDPAARESLRRLNAQLLEAGMTLQSMQDRLAETVRVMRQQLEIERARGVAAAPPGDSRSAIQGMPDLAEMMKDPDIVEAMQDPRVVGILQQCIADPSRMNEYANDEKVRKLILAMFRSQKPGGK